MKIQNCVGLQYYDNKFKYKQKNNVAFGSALGTKASEEMGLLISKCLKKLNISHNVVGIHSPSFPAANTPLVAEGVFDTGIGTYCGKNLKQFLKFVKTKFGVNALQIGPSTRISRHNFSPYSGSSFVGSKHLIDPLALVEDGLINSTSLAKYNRFKPELEATSKDHNIIEYGQAFDTIGEVLDEAYTKFKSLPETSELKKSFKEYKKLPQINYWLKNDAIFYTAMPKEYAQRGQEHISKFFWGWDDIDKKLNLYLSNPKSSKYPEAVARKQELMTKYADDIERFEFEQFLTHRQRLAAKDVFKSEGITLLGDVKIGNGSSDVWGHPKAFLVDLDENTFQGLNSTANESSPWNFYTINPDSAEGKEFLGKKMDNMFLYSDGTRLDAVFGYVEPWIRPMKAEVEKQSPKIMPIETSAKQENYGNKLLTEVNDSIVRNNINKDFVFGENLGGNPKAQSTIELEKLGIAELKNDNAQMVLSGLSGGGYGYYGYGNYGNIYGQYGNNLHLDTEKFLASLNVKHSDTKLKPFEKIWQATSSHDTTTLLEKYPDKYIRSAVIATNFKGSRNGEPGKGHKMQTFFADFFGMKQRYNDCFNQSVSWLTRLKQNIDEYYYRNIAAGKGINMPEAILDAANLKAKDLETTVADILGNEEVKQLRKYSTRLKSKTGPFTDKEIDEAIKNKKLFSQNSTECN